MIKAGISLPFWLKWDDRLRQAALKTLGCVSCQQGGGNSQSVGLDLCISDIRIKQKSFERKDSYISFKPLRCQIGFVKNDAGSREQRNDLRYLIILKPLALPTI